MPGPIWIATNLDHERITWGIVHWLCYPIGGPKHLFWGSKCCKFGVERQSLVHTFSNFTFLYYVFCYVLPWAPFRWEIVMTGNTSKPFPHHKQASTLVGTKEFRRLGHQWCPWWGCLHWIQSRWWTHTYWGHRLVSFAQISWPQRPGFVVKIPTPHTPILPFTSAVLFKIPFFIVVFECQLMPWACLW